MDLIFKNIILLSGQQAPFTGAWTSEANARDLLFSFYTNGSGIVQLEYKNAFGFTDELEGINFYTSSILTSGYSNPAFSTSPMSEVRAISSGSGQFWTAVTAQN